MSNIVDTTKKSGASAFAAQGNDAEGSEHLRHSGKTGDWTIDREPVEDPAAERIVVFPATTKVGEVRWGKSEHGDPIIVERNTSLLDDLEEAPAGPGFIPEGWNPYTSFQGARLSPNGTTSELTFTSTSWGGRFAIRPLVAKYEDTKRTRLPVCALHSRPRNDANSNHNPVFKIVSWVPASRFLGGDEPQQIAQIEAKPTAQAGDDASIKVGGRITQIIDDELPF